MAELSTSRQKWDFHNCAVIVAHPDDETLWAGGTILLHPDTNWTIVSLCRESDKDRAPKFHQAMEIFGAKGIMGDLNDSPEQKPLDSREVQDTIMSLLPLDRLDLIITHSQWGEYTQHRRHEETGKAVLTLLRSSRLFAKQLWAFAYEDGGGKYLPRPVKNTDIYIRLPETIWQKKYDIITKIYGFVANSFEAKTTPKEEAFGLFAQNRK